MGIEAVIVFGLLFAESLQGLTVFDHVLQFQDLELVFFRDCE
jgi:hypothetical protein